MIEGHYLVRRAVEGHPEDIYRRSTAATLHEALGYANFCAQEEHCDYVVVFTVYEELITVTADGHLKNTKETD